MKPKKSKHSDSANSARVRGVKYLMRIYFLIIFLAISPAAVACFSGEEYEQNWNNSTILLMVGFLLFSAAVLARIIRINKKLFIPVIIFGVSLIPAMIEIIRFGSGDCGIGLFEASKWVVYLMAIFTIYEICHLSYSKHRANNT